MTMYGGWALVLLMYAAAIVAQDPMMDTLLAGRPTEVSPYCDVIAHNVMEMIGSGCFAKHKGKKRKHEFLEFLMQKSTGDPGAMSPKDDHEGVFNELFPGPGEDASTFEMPMGKLVPVTGAAMPGDIVLSKGKNNADKTQFAVVLKVARIAQVLENGRKVSMKGRGHGQRKKLRDFAGDPKGCPSLRQHLVPDDGQPPDMEVVVDPDNMQPDDGCSPGKPHKAAQRARQAGKDTAYLQRDRKEGWVLAAALQHSIGIVKGHSKADPERTLVYRFFPRGVVCDNIAPGFEFKRFFPLFGPPRCHEDLTFTVLPVDDPTPVATPDLEEDSPFFLDSYTGTPDKLFIMVPGPESVSDRDWMTSTDGPNNLQNVLLNTGSHANSLFMKVDYQQTDIPEKLLIPDLMGSMQTIGKSIAIVIMKYVKQRTEMDSSLEPQTILDGVTCVGEGPGAHICGEAGHWVMRISQMMQWMEANDGAMPPDTPEVREEIMAYPSVMIGRIEALAPVKLPGHLKMIGLSPKSAKYVATYNTETEKFGSMHPLGLENYYFGGGPLQPGCNQGPLIEDQKCSVRRAVQYYLATLIRQNGGNDLCIEAYWCPADDWMDALRDGTCPKDRFTDVGPQVSPPPPGPPAFFNVPVGDQGPEFCPVPP